MWDLPGLGIEPMSPALASGFLTTAPPGKSPDFKILFIYFIFYFWLHHVACGISVPQPGIEPGPPQ